ncbi:MAG: universal stress protein [Candidatus Methylomirabilales bacterium]
MFARILVPLDGSPLAEAILPQVVELAQQHGAEVILLRVALAHTFPGVDATAAQVAAVEQAAAYLEAVQGRLGAGLATRTVVRYGHAAQEILDHVRAAGADCVAMCTHGRTGLRRWMLGSVAETVARGAEVPVLLLRPPAPSGAEAEAPGAARSAAPGPAAGPVPVPLRRILCPVDLSPESLAAIPYAAELAARFGSELTVLHAVYDPLEGGAGAHAHPSLGRLRAEMLREAEARLREHLADALPGGAARLEVVLGRPVPQILRHVRAHGTDLLVLGTKRRSGLEHLILGDTAEQLVRAAPCPVLTRGAAA